MFLIKYKLLTISIEGIIVGIIFNISSHFALFYKFLVHCEAIKKLNLGGFFRPEHLLKFYFRNELLIKRDIRQKQRSNVGAKYQSYM